MLAARPQPQAWIPGPPPPGPASPPKGTFGPAIAGSSPLRGSWHATPAPMPAAARLPAAAVPARGGPGPVYSPAPAAGTHVSAVTQAGPWPSPAPGAAAGPRMSSPVMVSPPGAHGSTIVHQSPGRLSSRGSSTVIMGPPPTSSATTTVGPQTSTSTPGTSGGGASLGPSHNNGVAPRTLTFDVADPDERQFPREEHAEAASVFDQIDMDGDGCISKLDFITAMQRNSSVSIFVLPGVDSSKLLTDPDVFDAVDSSFETIGAGKQRLYFADFASYFHRERGEKTPKSRNLSNIFDLIDRDGFGSISKLDLVSALQRDSSVSDFVLPGVDCSSLMSDQKSFDALEDLWMSITGGKSRMSFSDFETHFRSCAIEKTPKSRRCRDIFDRIDVDGQGCISKLKFLTAMQHLPEVDEFILPGTDSSQMMNNEWSFDAVDAMFDTIAAGKKRINYCDFERYFKSTGIPKPAPSPVVDRSRKRVLIIGPGFGREMNPRQGYIIQQCGYQVHWVSNIPNPEMPNFPVDPYLGNVMSEIERFKPDAIACASKGGVYVVGLWRKGLWKGPTLMINAHPACQQLPQGVRVVLAHGANDEVYPASREELEALVETGTPGLCYLYYTANSGQVSPGLYTREGDMHNMESLLLRDTLPRLLDGLLSPLSAEEHIVRTWRDRLSEARLSSELWLGYTPQRLRRLWASTGHHGRDHSKTFEVSRDSEEFEHIVTVFKAMPRETPAYLLYPPQEWDRISVLRIERVENGFQDENCVRPYYESLRKSFQEQSQDFEPGVHTCWAFHGAERSSIDSIVTNQVVGFQPLATGSRNSSVWGSGAYFARDAQYVAGSHFCGQPAADGTRQMLMCLLIMGMPCLGDPEQRGVLPFRQKPHRYNSSVDFLSSPEVFIVQHSGAAVPAYVITFR